MKNDPLERPVAVEAHLGTHPHVDRADRPLERLLAAALDRYREALQRAGRLGGNVHGIPAERLAELRRQVKCLEARRTD